MLDQRGMIATTWDKLDPAHLLGAKPAAMVDTQGVGTLGGGLAAANGPALMEANAPKPWHPDNPLFWFGMLASVTFGLIGAATSVRVGPFKAAAAAGRT